MENVYAKLGPYRLVGRSALWSKDQAIAAAGTEVFNCAPSVDDVAYLVDRIIFRGNDQGIFSAVVDHRQIEQFTIDKDCWVIGETLFLCQFAVVTADDPITFAVTNNAGIAHTFHVWIPYMSVPVDLATDILQKMRELMFEGGPE